MLKTLFITFIEWAFLKTGSFQDLVLYKLLESRYRPLILDSRTTQQKQELFGEMFFRAACQLAIANRINITDIAWQEQEETRNNPVHVSETLAITGITLTMTAIANDTILHNEMEKQLVPFFERLKP